MTGILTNYHDWYFTKFSLLDEFLKVREYLRTDDIIKYSQNNEEYQIYEKISIIDSQSQINKKNLQIVIKILEELPWYDEM